MSNSRPEELIRAEQLLYNGRVEEVLEIVINFEKRSELTPKNKLSALLLKGWVYSLKIEVKKEIEVGELAYPMSQELGLIPESIEALFLKAHIFLLGKPDEAHNLTIEAEKLLNSLSDELPANITKLKLLLMYMKSWIYFYKSDFNIALNFASEALTLGEKIKYNVYVGFTLTLFAAIYWGKGEPDTALEYVMKSLELMEDLGFQSGIASNLYIIGEIYFAKGDLNSALEFCKKTLIIEKISDWTKSNTLLVLGGIYQVKGELNAALKYFKQGLKLADKIMNFLHTASILVRIGNAYRQKGDLDQAEKYLKKGVIQLEKLGGGFFLVSSILYLLLINLEKNSREQADQYLSRLKELADESENKMIRQGYLLGKSSILRASKRMRDKVKAESLLKQIVEDDIVNQEFYTLALISLCELLIKELSMYDNPEVLDEINPLIEQLLKISEDQQSFSWLAEAKLLQAKLALIQMNVEEAKRLLTETQQIAELHGLSLLAQKISNEHDILLDQIGNWERIGNKNAPMADRIQLASIDGVLDRLQGKRAVEPPEMVEEVSTLLLIIAEGGVLLFSYPFTDEWKFDEELFSGFITAFKTFSNDFFSKKLDRVKFGEDTLLMQSAGDFSFCYLYKGQTYLAKQKLSKFTESVQNNASIWQVLEKFYKTSQVLEVKDIPSLKSLITDIFVNKNP